MRDSMADLVYSLMWVGGIAFAPFLFLDSLVSPDTKKRLSESLKSRPDALDNLPQLAAYLFGRVFGESHFTLRCLGASVLASMLFLILMYGLRMFLVLAAHKSASASDAYTYIVSELGYPFTSEARTSFGVSLVANLVFDFYAAFYFFAFIFMFSPQQMILLPGGDPHSLVPMMEIMILLNFVTSDAYPVGTTMQFLTHSHAIPVILAFTFLPIFLTSVFFYASVAPSLWLWLFLFAGIVSRLLAPAWPSALHIFNFEQSPFRILGLVASALVVLVWTFALFVINFGLSALNLTLNS